MIDFAALEQANAPLNAFVDWDPAATLGAQGPLAGLTAGVKANIAVKGLPWTAGMELFRGRMADSDAAVVAKLREAGAAIIGMTNMEEAALGAKTDNPWFGATQNPHKIGYTAGGSSGGSAAAVAAGLCDIALGTDTMGSVRIPAAYCGIYGFKPAQSAVSQDGLELAEPSLDVIGPMARSLELLEQTARIVSDFGEGDSGEKPVAALATQGMDCDLQSRNNSSKIFTISWRGLEYPELPEQLPRIRFAGFIKTAKAMAAHYADADPSKLSDHLKKLLSYGERRSEADWAEDQAILETTANRMQDIVAEHGYIISITTPHPAFPHDQEAPVNQADLTCLANIANLPAISLPSGCDRDSMPLGMQIIGQRGCEAGLFEMARQYDGQMENLKGSSYRKPGYYLK